MNSESSPSEPDEFRVLLVGREAWRRSTASRLEPRGVTVVEGPPGTVSNVDAVVAPRATVPNGLVPPPEVLNRVTDGIFALDSEWTVTYANDRICNYYRRRGATDSYSPETSDSDEYEAHRRAELREFVGGHFWDFVVDAEETAIYEAAHRAMEDQRPVELEAYYEPLDRWFATSIFPSATGLTVLVRDVTEVRENERESRELHTILSVVSDGVYATDAEGRIRWLNDGYLEMTGYDREELIGQVGAGLLFDSSERERAVATRESVAAGSETPVVFETDLRHADGSPLPVETRVSALFDDGEYRGTVGIVRDVTERRRHERQVRTLTETARELLSASDAATVARVVADAAVEGLGFEGAAVWRPEESANYLVPTVFAGGARRAYAAIGQTGAAGDRTAWSVFADRETRTEADADDPPFAATVWVSLGPYGVLVCGSDAASATDATEVVRALANDAVASFARLDSERILSSQTTELTEHRRSHESLDRYLDVYTDVISAVVSADSREEVNELLCARLSDHEGVDFAWVGERTPTGRVVPRSWSGDAVAYLDSASDWTGEPAVRAAADGRTVVVHDVWAGVDDEPWRRDATARGFRSVVSVPLTHHTRDYGVISLYAGEANQFDADAVELFETLAAFVAFAIGAVERTASFLSRGPVELTFEVTDPGFPPLALARRLDRSLRLDGASRFVGGHIVTTLSVPDCTEAEIRAAAAEMASIDSVTVTRVEGTNLRVEASIVASHAYREIAAQGAVLKSLESTPTAALATFLASEATDSRALADVMSIVYPDTRLVSKRSAAGATASGDTLGELTTRQYEVFITAVRGGYFESPRRHTGEQLADELGISATAFHKHLRTVERKLFERLVDRGVV
ncbi:PAS domain-containing protein [Halogeometricum limi]|uniref:PAS domain S-box-containing protein n=1 Tax=Halogeometricum limi TaxID=555875 RepID=A0A1I6I152_9EURY|nr:PAS domain-containing protein [Halogeometricum limi]SFR60394.1 PAS domain S-box-containing protein [Halogeometricum limi]